MDKDLVEKINVLLDSLGLSNDPESERIKKWIIAELNTLFRKEVKTGQIYKDQYKVLALGMLKQLKNTSDEVYRRYSIPTLFILFSVLYPSLGAQERELEILRIKNQPPAPPSPPNIINK